jgi:hypothetical protein
MENQQRELKIEVSVYSPRWNPNDIHILTMDEQKLHFNGNGKGAICSRGNDGDFEWTGYEDTNGNSLIAILENDCIFPPTILVKALQMLWVDWASKAIGDDQARVELKHLFDWVDTCTRNRVSTDYWSTKF